MKSGETSKLSPVNTLPKAPLIEKAPFYIVPFQGGMTATFGGPLINTKAEIQDLDGKSIAGLYAAGNDVGGMYGDSYDLLMAGSTVGFAVNSARIAVDSAAEYIKAQK